MRLSTDLPEGRRGQTVAVALTLCALAVIWLLGVGPLLDWQADQRAKLDGQQQILTRMQSLADSLPPLRAERDRRRAAGDAMQSQAGGLLAGSSDAVAAAELQQSVQAVVQQAGGRLNSFEILPPEPVGRYRRIGLRVSLSAPFDAEMAIVSALESGRPRMLIDDLNLQSAGLRGANAPMDAAFSVFAYRDGAAP